MMLDLGSKGGTFINGEACEELIGYPISDDDVITFASSTRSYIVIFYILIYFHIN